jgi:hypothetical protein
MYIYIYVSSYVSYFTVGFLPVGDIDVTQHVASYHHNLPQPTTTYHNLLNISIF